MSNTTLAPCPKCPLCGDAMRYAGGDETGPKSWWDCGNPNCDLRWHEMRLEQINSHPNLRRIAELEEELAKLKESVAFIISSEPAHDGSGGLYIEHFDGEGNPVGAESVDPIGLLGWIYDKAKTALHEAT